MHATALPSIRDSTPSDLAAIHALHLAAFDDSEAAAVARLAGDLLADPTARPLLSLVALADDAVVGHVIFSAVQVQGHEAVGAAILAPLAVAPAHQRRGLGRGLVERGLELLRQRGVALVLVLGDPRYYGRFGFRAGHAIAAPHPLPYPEAWQALELVPGTLARIRGVARCAAVMEAPEYW
jgi:putative acetyltransferase